MEDKDRSSGKQCPPPHAADYERILAEYPQLKKELDFRYGAIAVRLSRSWNPIVRLYEFFLDMHI